VTESSRLLLHELIAALDRRVPRLGHPDEQGIALDAAAMRTRALDEIARLDGQSTVRE